jgi:hypothetical protein
MMGLNRLEICPDCGQDLAAPKVAVGEVGSVLLWCATCDADALDTETYLNVDALPRYNHKETMSARRRKYRQARKEGDAYLHVLHSVALMGESGRG